MKPYFSVIVPIYNVESYLETCIESVRVQTFKNFELILVNDGSPDSSHLICDNYKKVDERVRVIHKQNGGLSSARNTGIKESEGQYICFLDGDDYLVENTLEKLNKILKQNHEIDLITCGYNNVYTDGVKTKISLTSKNEVLSKAEYLYNLTESPNTFWSAWQNVYKREIIEKNKLLFTENLIGAEDCDFHMKYVNYCNIYVCTDFPLVNYRLERTGSIMQVMSKGALLGQLKVFSNNYKKYIQEKNPIMMDFFAKKYANTVYLLHRLEDSEGIVEVSEVIQKNKEILMKAKGLKYRLSRLVWLVAGYKKGSNLLYTLNNKKIRLNFAKKTRN